MFCHLPFKANFLPKIFMLGDKNQPFRCGFDIHPAIKAFCHFRIDNMD